MLSIKTTAKAILLAGLTTASSSSADVTFSTRDLLRIHLKGESKTAELVEMSRSIQQLSAEDRMKLANDLLSRPLPLVAPESEFALSSIVNRRYSVIDFNGLYTEIIERDKKDLTQKKTDEETLTAYGIALANTICRGSDPPFPYSELEQKYVRYEEVKITQDWPLKVLNAMKECQDDWRVDGYIKIDITGSLVRKVLAERGRRMMEQKR